MPTELEKLFSAVRFDQGISVIHGPAGSGRTSLAYEIADDFCREGRILLFDCESLPLSRIRKYPRIQSSIQRGGSVIYTPSTMVDVFNAIHSRAQEEGLLFVVDGLNMLPAEATDSLASAGRALAEFFRRLRGAVNLLVTWQAKRGFDGQSSALPHALIHKADRIFSLQSQSRRDHVARLKSTKLRSDVEYEGDLTLNVDGRMVYTPLCKFDRSTITTRFNRDPAL